MKNKLETLNNYYLKGIVHNKHEHVNFPLEKREKIELAPAPGNGAAASLVRVGLRARLAIVVGGSGERTRHSASLNRLVAYVVAAR